MTMRVPLPWSAPAPEDQKDMPQWAEQDNNSNWMVNQQLRAELGTLNKRGSWTPSITFATPGNLSVVYGTQIGDYERSGRIITLTAFLSCTPTFTTSASDLHITGIPLAVAASSVSYRAIGACAWSGITKAGYAQVNIQAVQGSSFLLLAASGSGVAVANIGAGDVPSGGTLSLQFVVRYRF